jgi:hypothetical protein
MNEPVGKIIGEFEGNPYPNPLSPNGLGEQDHWIIQWKRVSRYYKRIKVIESNKRECSMYDYDDILSFFIHCYHLYDWIKRSYPNLEKKLLSFRKDNNEIGCCRDLCNGFKHKNMDSPSFSSDLRGMFTYDYLSEKDKNPNVPIFLFNIDGKLVRYNAYELVERVYLLSENFIKTNIIS